jgi:hypothetical protein
MSSSNPYMPIQQFERRGAKNERLETLKGELEPSFEEVLQDGVTLSSRSES